jgi:6,7-dimethyl-8-ribityllumazine synthase
MDTKMEEKKLYIDENDLTDIKIMLGKSSKDSFTSGDRYKVHVVIVSTMWNRPYVQRLVDGVKNKLQELDTLGCINITETKVPGCWEIPFKVKKWVSGNITSPYFVVIPIGVLIKGETAHFDLISQSVFQQLMKMQCYYKNTVPIINGILTVNNEEQIEERIELASNWAITALQMLS